MRLRFSNRLIDANLNYRRLFRFSSLMHFTCRETCGSYLVCLESESFQIILVANITTVNIGLACLSVRSKKLSNTVTPVADTMYIQRNSFLINDWRQGQDVRSLEDWIGHARERNRTLLFQRRRQRFQEL